MQDGMNGSLSMVRTVGADQESGPGWNAAGQVAHPVGQGTEFPQTASAASTDRDINAAAVASYRASVRAGRPLSERKLAGQFGKTSRRWARNRIAEARESSA
jgi:hypothetical protein